MEQLLLLRLQFSKCLISSQGVWWETREVLSKINPQRAKILNDKEL